MKMRISPQAALFVTLLIFIVGILITSSLGLYKTQNTKTPGKLTVAGYIDQNDPADIKGSYTFDDVSRLYNIPYSDLATAFVLGDSDASLKVSQLESLNNDAAIEMGPPSVRLFTAYYLGIPYSVTDAYLPQTAVEILLEKGHPTPEQRATIESIHTKG